MAIRFYFCKFVGDGTDDNPFKLDIFDYMNNPHFAGFYDGRELPELVDGWAFVWNDVSDVEHAAIIADPNNTYILLEDVSNTPLGLDSQLFDLADQSSALAILENHGIDTTGLVNPKTIRDVVKRIYTITVIKCTSPYIDQSKGLDVAQNIPTSQLAALKQRYTSAGFNPSSVNQNDSMRSILGKLHSQPIATPFD